MPDIAMCVNSACALRGGCYRYLAIANDARQSYRHFVPSGTECEMYWAVSNRRVLTVDQADIANRTGVAPASIQP